MGLLEIDLQVQSTAAQIAAQKLLHSGGNSLAGQVAVLVPGRMRVLEAESLGVHRDVLEPREVTLASS